jgi:hypothetical protein
MKDVEAEASRNGIIVVVEAGSVWTTWARACRAEPDDTAVIAQHPDEGGGEFTRRASQRIARLTSTGWTPHTAVLALSGAHGADRETRVQIARALIRSLRGSDGGTLLLAGDEMFSGAARHDVFGLAQALTELLLGTPLAIRVLFTDEQIPNPPTRVARPLASTTTVTLGDRKPRDFAHDDVIAAIACGFCPRS